MVRLEDMYERRLGPDVTFRKRMYEVLCSQFYQQFVPKNATVLDVAAGYCEFINTIEAKKKIAIDINSDVKKFAAKDVKVILSPSTNMRKIPSNSVDVAYTSNFFEHIEKKDIVKTLQEVRRVLKKGGKFLILQPNIRYCPQDYWMFFDHITPLDDRSLGEALELHGFEIEVCKPKFLPFSTKGRLPKSIFLLQLYLALPPLQWLFGKQAFFVARKP